MDEETTENRPHCGVGDCKTEEGLSRAIRPEKPDTIVCRQHREQVWIEPDVTEISPL